MYIATYILNQPRGRYGETKIPFLGMQKSLSVSTQVYNTNISWPPIKIGFPYIEIKCDPENKINYITFCRFSKNLFTLSSDDRKSHILVWFFNSLESGSVCICEGILEENRYQSISCWCMQWPSQQSLVPQLNNDVDKSH